jgi:hypothetical protein
MFAPRDSHPYGIRIQPSRARRMKAFFTFLRGCSFFFKADGTQTRSFGDVGSMSGLPESGHGWAIYEYTT